MPTYVENLGVWRGLENWANAKAIEDEESRWHIQDRPPPENSNYRVLEFVAAHPAGTAAGLLAGGAGIYQPGKAALIRASNSAVLREVPLNLTKGYRDAGSAYAPAGYTRAGQWAYAASYALGTAARALSVP